MRGVGIGVAIVLCVGLGAETAWCQVSPSAASFNDSATPAPPPQPQPPTSAPAPDAAAPDIVRLKNGGLLRGKIGELVPGGTVTIVTVTGSTRVLNMSDVVYAGPAAEDPRAQPTPPPAAAPLPPPPAQQPAGELQRRDQPSNQGQEQPYVTAHAAEARVQFRSAEKNTTFYRRSATAYAEGHYGWTKVSAVSKRYERLCTAPCEVSLPAGREIIATGDEDSEPNELETVTLSPGGTQLRLIYRGRPKLRHAGKIFIAAGSIVAGASFAAFLVQSFACGDRCYGTDATRQVAFLGITALGLAVGLGAGIPLVATGRDRLVFEKVPYDTAANRPLSLARGLTLSGKF